MTDIDIIQQTLGTDAFWQEFFCAKEASERTEHALKKIEQEKNEKFASEAKTIMRKIQEAAVQGLSSTQIPDATNTFSDPLRLVSAFNELGYKSKFNKNYNEIDISW